jgi:hypothetical protein
MVQELGSPRKKKGWGDNERTMASQIVNKEISKDLIIAETISPFSATLLF